MQINEDSFMRLEIFLSMLLLATSGCASLQNFDASMLVPPVVAGLAGITAYKLTEDQSADTQAAWTAGAAAGGLVASEMVRRYVKDEYRAKFRDGYELGRSDAVKQQYWIMQNRQKEDTGHKRHFKYYKFPGVTVRDGVNYTKHHVTVRMEE
jgi:hypothetical protein